MKLAAVCRLISSHHNLRRITRPLQYRSFQPDFVPRDPNAKLKKYKFPAFYDPYGLRPPPSEKIIQLAEQIASLTPEERSRIGPAIRDRVMLPKLQPISVQGMDLVFSPAHPHSEEREIRDELNFSQDNY
ncbi:unnamed protein product [Fraxinus pennsylvanica]|uniref:Uncharacterized protein n=1 Tax=Fraxinus pennsylvanica TaxID=56036 RepID=A0AAD1Z9I6_9LAMI|nr:unnamed protein product [Fraxinus pennsylvanica]